jgi:hypothetical protein
MRVNRALLSLIGDQRMQTLRTLIVASSNPVLSLSDSRDWKRSTRPGNGISTTRAYSTKLARIEEFEVELTSEGASYSSAPARS